MVSHGMVCDGRVGPRGASNAVLADLTSIGFLSSGSTASCAAAVAQRQQTGQHASCHDAPEADLSLPKCPPFDENAHGRLDSGLCQCFMTTLVIVGRNV